MAGAQSSTYYDREADPFSQPVDDGEVVPNEAEFAESSEPPSEELLQDAARQEIFEGIEELPAADWGEPIDVDEGNAELPDSYNTMTAAGLRRLQDRHGCSSHAEGSDAC